MSTAPHKRKPLIHGPLLGALLRMARQELVNHLSQELRQAGFGDVRPSQYAVMQQLAVAREGLRLTQMASHAGISKPSMSALVDSLATHGYVRRAPDPTDQRAQLIQLTERGRKFGKVASIAVQRVERCWAERLGEDDVETLRDILQRLVDSRPELKEPPGHFAERA